MRKPAPQESSRSDLRESYTTAIRECREIASNSVLRIADQFATTVGLSISTSTFHENLTQAIVSFVTLHLDGPRRIRYSILRKQTSRVEAAASTVAKHLRLLQAALDDLTPLYRNAIYERLEIPRILALRFEALSARSDMYAEGLKLFEKGGAPKMLEFEVFVRDLARGFEVATGREAKVTWNPEEHRFEGQFVLLVENVLQIASTCSERLGIALSFPKTSSARGRYIYEKTRAGRSMSRYQWHVA